MRGAWRSPKFRGSERHSYRPHGEERRPKAKRLEPWRRHAPESQPSFETPAFVSRKRAPQDEVRICCGPSHRPLRRSSMRMSTMETPPFARGGGSVSSSFGKDALRRGLTIPLRTSRARRSLSVVSAPMITGSRRATGCPRSVIKSEEPAFRLSIRARRLLLASVMLTLFISIEWRDQKSIQAQFRDGNLLAREWPKMVQPVK